VNEAKLVNESTKKTIERLEEEKQAQDMVITNLNVLLLEKDKAIERLVYLW
jgi:uncharacterized coiled-coil protein SlyX